MASSLSRHASVASRGGPGTDLGNTGRFRNIFSSVVPDRYYDGLAVAVTCPTLLRCNDKFFATPWSNAAGGLSGALAIHSLSTSGKVNRTPYVIRATNEQLLDFDFYPFEKTVIATTGRDGVVKVWRFPGDGQLVFDITAAEYYLAGHEKRVDVLKFHPTVAALLLTASSDMTMRLWDFREMQEIQMLEGFEEPTLSVAWSYAGDLVLQACKDGKLNMYDPRAKNTSVRSTTTEFSAAKGIGVCFINESFDFITTAFDKSGDRQLCLWDGRKPDKPLQSERAGNSPGALMPFYDPTIGLLYLTSKGEGIRLYEYTEADRTIKYLTEVKTDRPQTAVAMLPKFVCEVDKFEIARFLKLCNDSYVQTMSVRVPRKSGNKLFPEDLFPPTPQLTPSATIEMWKNGAAAVPVLMDLKPEGAVSVYEAPPEDGGLKRSVTKIKKKKQEESPEGHLQMEIKGFFYNSWERRWVSMLGSRIHVSMEREDAHSLASIALADIVELWYYTARDDEEQTMFAVVLRNKIQERFKAASDKERDRWLKAFGDATGRKVIMATAAMPVPGTENVDTSKSPASADTPSSSSFRGYAGMRSSIDPAYFSKLVIAPKKTTIRGEVYRDGYLDIFSEGWFGTARWARRYVVLQDGVINGFTNDRVFLDSSSPPLDSFRLESVISVRLCEMGEMTEDRSPTTTVPNDLSVFQLATPRESVFYKAPDTQTALEWITVLMKTCGKAIREARRRQQPITKTPNPQLDDEEDEAEENIPDELLAPVVEGYITEGSTKLWLAIIKGNFYYYKSNMSKAPLKIIKARDISDVRPITQPGLNGFEVIVRGQTVRHFTRTDVLAQWWDRKIKFLRDADFDLMDFIGLKDIVANTIAREALEKNMVPLLIDPLRVKAGEQPMLLQVHPKRNLAQQVKLDKSSLASDASYVLDVARGADLANRIRIKDRGGNATIVFVNDVAGRSVLPFHKLLNITNSSEELATDKLALATTGPFRGIKIYRLNPSKDTKKVIVPVYDELGDQLPSKEILLSDYTYVIDADAEIFVWSGSTSGLYERKLANWLAGLLALQASRTGSATITRVLENTETMIFKEKFADYPGMLPVHVGPMVEMNDNYVKMEQPEINITALQRPVFLQEIDIDDGKGTIEAFWIIRKNKRAFGDNYEFDKELIDRSEYGQFYSGESYLLRYKYMQKNAEKYIVYFWQGRDSSITEKGASALETINVADETGGNAIQVRVEQGKEPRHFFMLFGNQGMVIHLGKQQAERGPDQVRMYQVRELMNGQVRAIEASHAQYVFHSEHVTAIVRGDTTFCWNGRYSSLREQQAVRTHNILRLPLTSEIQSIDEDSEPQALLQLFDKDQWASREPGRKQQKYPTYLFLCSGSSGVVVVEPMQVFTQDDLDQSHVFILDCITDVFVWVGGQSMVNEKVIAMETAQKYIMNSPRGHKPYTNLWVTYPYEEPLTFTRHFHCWSTSKFPADKGQLPIQRPLDVILGQLTTKTHSFSVLAGEQIPEGIDRTRLEEYLSDSEFLQVFGVARPDFLVLPKWKREQLKRQKGLF